MSTTASDEKKAPSDNGSRDVESVQDPSGVASGSTPLYNAEVDTSGIDDKKLLRKIDWYLIPWLSLLYLLSFLDRTSIGKCVIQLCEYRIIID